MARFLGIDLGSKRIGLALSDPLGMIASPRPYHLSQGITRDIEFLCTLAVEEEVEGFVIGLPLLLRGTASSMSRMVESFARALETASQKPVFLWEERFSSVAAERSLRESGLSGQRRRQLVDSVAAALILQAWLDSRSNKQEEEE